MYLLWHGQNRAYSISQQANSKQNWEEHMNVQKYIKWIIEDGLEELAVTTIYCIKAKKLR